MKIGFNQQIITPKLSSELVGYIPSRKAESVQKDLLIKVITLVDIEKKYVWLTCDLLGLDLYFKEVLLNKLKDNNIYINDLQMFTTHTHSGVRILNKEEYYSEDVEALNKEYFDFLVNQAYTAISNSLNDLKDFTYKLALGKMENFQTNRLNKDYYSHDDILTIEITTEANNKLLLYSFSGHPTILDRNSTRISPDYVGVVASVLEEFYEFTMFFNAPCGDMSTRFTKLESSMDEVNRLGKIAANCVLKTLDNLSEAKKIKNYKVSRYTYRLNFKEFLDIESAQKLYDDSKRDLENAIENNLDPLEIRALRATYEGYMFNLNHSKQNYKHNYLDSNIYIIKIDDYSIVNLASEVFSVLAKPLKIKNVWTNSLSDQYQTYLCDKSAYDLNTYEALSSLYKKGEGEKLIDFTLSKL